MKLLLKAPLYFDLEMYSSAQWLEKVGGPEMCLLSSICNEIYLESICASIFFFSYSVSKLVHAQCELYGNNIKKSEKLSLMA